MTAAMPGLYLASIDDVRHQKGPTFIVAHQRPASNVSREHPRYCSVLIHLNMRPPC